MKLKFEAVVEITITDEPMKIQNGPQQIQMAAIGLKYCNILLKKHSKIKF